MNWEMTDEDYEIIKKNLNKQLNEDQVSPIHIHQLFETLDNPDSTEEDYNSIGLRICSSLFNPNNTNFYLDNSDKNIIKSIKKEIHKVICKNNDDYSKDRSTFVQNFNSAILIVSTTIAAKFGDGTESVFITGIVSSALLFVFKFGKNIWCEYNNDFSKENN
ncbi:hypothetical protein [Paenibacillus sp. IHBB 10380]|uniref:hypothetical protein n=1 Tax=Paenibacillus sp. IHBB 10380 TaxID=1566358 RepID=UPI0005CF9F16|nr:hypothetical protein [Paenibacillus sp. IHBB 10380]AJS59993.1 hypothetical protein UB51_17670 [Paenibacillus sp. IHBB 10380]